MAAEDIRIDGIYLERDGRLDPCPIAIEPPQRGQDGAFCALVRMPALLPDPVEIAGMDPAHSMQCALVFVRGHIFGCRARREGRLVNARGGAELPLQPPAPVDAAPLTALGWV